MLEQIAGATFEHETVLLTRKGVTCLLSKMVYNAMLPNCILKTFLSNLGLDFDKPASGSQEGTSVLAHSFRFVTLLVYIYGALSTHNN
jgi:hypothetical protein